MVCLGVSGTTVGVVLAEDVYGIKGCTRKDGLIQDTVYQNY